ncbi:serine/threonine-protein kinase [Clavibacter michiganensis]|uniref:serine/threonine-protein kinase n=1 Tax=Clavibacter michiganensis TaxID=28447 RepID=UPI0026DD230D|nr:serine/threonine-protein kinase [Clavibacter michiganensis]MDO4026010.1 serine/threonine-protein kinase [Clavibacter michiganensis]MDO4033966.1 serine/threonine-protein kinase [Clavibacter michiganensis]MDO4047928.1 serine/threonine-protein kinase [Clavibacter michiganensis]MDO4106983.1 serine/threonine-protein kinase [Clavibacter michiganensis]MDO4134367.1 serine/threonine-protein kinase [Clavibacter michiganensis]
MARRLPSAPPVLPGFTYVTVLGSGGFADVFLYEQDMPRRQVAVKVMLAEIVTDRLRAMFRAEADLMAQLSAHPSVLTVHQASVAADGRPYLVMELCSSSLSDRYRREPLGVAEVLRVGIRIASAVETAHRAGVLHRDIKPANILTTAFGHPVLSDFGIASTLEDAAATDAVGLSIPWSAPEVLADESPGTVRSEVWSLAATVYSLLAGRSPFEVPGGQNAPADLVARIQRARPLPTGRADVPERLELVLRRAMSRQPEARPESALAFVRELQSVEAELRLAQTPLEVASEEWASAVAAGVDEDDDPTRVRGIAQVDPGTTGPGGARGTAGVRRARRKAASAASRQTAGAARPGVPATASDQVRAGSASTSLGRSGSGPVGLSTPVRPAVPGRSAFLARHRVAFAAAAAGAIVASVGVGALLGGSGGGTAVRDIPVVGEIQASAAADGVLFSWSDPGLGADDAYQVVRDGGLPSTQRDTTFRVTSGSGGSAGAGTDDRACIRVTVTRDGIAGDASTEKCAELPR